MDREEFIRRTGENISEEDYAKIEMVYLNHPGIRDVADMVGLYERFGMKVVELLVRPCAELAARQERLMELGHDYEDLDIKCDELAVRVEHLERVVRLYRSVITVEDMLTRLTPEILENAMIGRE